MSEIRKAVITAAGRGTRLAPATNTVQKELFPLVDTDGRAKPTLQIIAEEALASGLTEICIVANPQNAEPIRRHFTTLSETLGDANIQIVIQHEQHGYGHAVYQAREWAGEDQFVLLLGDHVYLSPTSTRCTRQVVAAAEAIGSQVSAVRRTPEALLPRLGTIKGDLIADTELTVAVYEVQAMVEKPSIEYAREHLRTPGLPDGEFLCFFGIHVFPPAIFDCLQSLIGRDIRVKGEIQMTSAQELLLEREQTIVCEVHGERYDMGVPEGLIETQIALALHSPYAATAISAFHSAVNHSQSALK